MTDDGPRVGGGLGRVSLALAGSLALHVVAGAALLPWLAPRPVPQQAMGDSRLMLATMPVARGQAKQQVPDMTQVAGADTTGLRDAGQGVPQRRAAALLPDGPNVGGGDVRGAVGGAVAPDGDRLGAVTDVARDVAATELTGAVQPATPPQNVRVAAMTAPTILAKTAALPAAAQASAIPTATVVRAAIATSGATLEAVLDGAPAVIAQDLPATAQPPATPDGARVAATTAPVIEVKAAPLPDVLQTPTAPTATQVRATVAPVARLSGVAAVAPRLAELTLLGDPEPAVSATAVRAQVIQASVTNIAARAPDSRPVSAGEMHAPTLRADPGPAPVRVVAPRGSAVTAARTPAQRVPARRPMTPRVSGLDSAGTVLQAGLEWSGAGGVALDGASIATLQAFLQPGQAAGQDVRDRMAGAMAAPDCARVHSVFDPDTGMLELRGHVPDAAARAPLIAALQGQIGAALPLRDALQILPRPQCALLDGIAALGLPQSEEQLTDTDLVGENAQVREYAFVEGARLVIDLNAPDYPAYVYVDYFDASGQVLHLMPNDRTPLRRMAPDQVFAIGRGTDLDLRIAPPFGQDIAVAFASSVPLYDGIRPLVEPAAPYLADMQARIADARAADPAFRGEWVYLFVATSAATP